jgi:Fe-S-cluster containining protein
MGKNTVRFKCHQTLRCCTELVVLPTPFDVVQIARATGLKPLEFIEFLTPDEISEVDDDDPTWLACGGERHIMALQRDEKRGCYFINRRLKACTIYGHRPLLCRLFPFKLLESRDGTYKGFGVHTDVICPRNKDGVNDTAELHAIYLKDKKHQDDYQDLVRVFNRRRTPGKRPEDFVGMFYHET